jgi:hypothetical protein
MGAWGFKLKAMGNAAMGGGVVVLWSNGVLEYRSIGEFHI